MKADIEPVENALGLGDGARLLALCEPTGNLDARLKAIGRKQGLKPDVDIEGLLARIRHVLHSRAKHPLGRLPDLRSGWVRTGDPLYVWEALRFCAKAKCEHPDWVSSYIVECANRMPRPGAERDVRKLLSAALGFPAKRGPKKNFPRLGADVAEHMILAHVFAYAIEQGCSPARAAAEAADLLGSHYADCDARTLMALVARHFGLSSVPQSKVAWRRALVRIMKNWK
jgi:hypothetical protein